MTDRLTFGLKEEKVQDTMPVEQKTLPAELVDKSLSQISQNNASFSQYGYDRR